MEEHTSKRRRISPRNSAAGAGPASSGATQQQQQLESTEPARSRSRRPSFASPTKASLARHYPHSLQQKRSSSPSKSTTTLHLDERIILESFNATPVTVAESIGASDPIEEEEQVTRRDIEFPSSSQSVRRIGGSFAIAPRRSPAKPKPRPLPPPAPEGDDELNAVLGRSARPLPVTGVSISLPEPELPPLYPTWFLQHPREGSTAPMMSRLGGEANGKPGSSIRGNPFQIDSSRDSAPSIPLDARTNPARQIPAQDANTDKRKERDSLRDEIAKLRRDLRVVSKENEHIRLMQSSGQTISSADEDAVLDVVRRYLIEAEEPSIPAPSHQLMKAALNPMGLGLLPFSRPTPLVVTPQDQEDVSKIKSHHPVAMTAEEELPYLQLFSPFTVASSIAVLPQLPNQPLKQRRLITFRSKDVPGLFTSKIEMVVNAMNLSILELSVLAIEPSAKAELTPFLDKICTGDCNRSMQRNVGILSWAMGEWYRVAIQRARLWSKMDSELAVKGGLLQATREMRKRKKRRRRDDEEESEAEGTQSVSLKPAALLHFMGQQFFDLDIPPKDASDPASSLRLEWKIEFDWVGEAQSKVDVLIGVPGKWRTADQRGILGKLPKLFQDLVESGEEPNVAVKTIAALLTGERGAHDTNDE
ncbi:hypothetical protein PT974_03728 [Cladobotryum mycophilum]|uniref:Uncharacterized protein n=1 Tax=Cladobotryum mycophilum TaxID=491253 RepID=A0ABR0ST81_9HYPO